MKKVQSYKNLYLGKFVVVSKIHKKMVGGGIKTLILAKNKTGKKVYIKHIEGKVYSQVYKDAKKELEILKSFDNFKHRGKTYTVLFPKVFAEKVGKREISFATFRVIGKPLNSIPSTQIVEVLVDTINSLRQATKLIPESLHLKIINHTVKFYLIKFPINLLRVYLKDSTTLSLFPSLSYILLKNYLSLFKTNYLVLTHNDLNSSNFIINNNKVTLLDFEMSDFSHPEKEAVLASCFLARFLTKKELLNFIKRTLTTPDEVQRFNAICAYRLVSLLAVDNVNQSEYMEVKKYTKVFINTIYPRIQPKTKTAKNKIAKTINIKILKIKEYILNIASLKNAKRSIILSKLKLKKTFNLKLK